MTLVLTKAELERMRATIRGPQGDTTVQDRKAHLKQLSNDRMKNWPNTLEALRKKKESFLKDREEKEELKRQEIDREVSCLILMFTKFSVTPYHFCGFLFAGS